MAGFALDIKKNIAAFNVGVEKTMRGTAIVVFGNIIESTPADEGRARASWVATGKKPSTKNTTHEDKSGEPTKSKMEQSILSIKDATAFTLTSNLPYIMTLEFGGYPDPVKTEQE